MHPFSELRGRVSLRVVPGGAGGGMQLFFPANVTGRPWEAEIWVMNPTTFIESFGKFRQFLSKVLVHPYNYVFW